MYSNNISVSKKILSFVMGIIMLIMILSSELYIAHESEHNCIGDDCPICACIAQCERVLEFISSVTFSNYAICFNFCITILSVCIPVLFFTQKTPVLKKVRMNN